MFSEVAEIAQVAARLGQFQQLLKTQVILIFNFTRPHAITYTNMIILLQVKKVADSLHLENSPQFGDEWYQFLCEVGIAKNSNYLHKNLHH